jgi:hypothetical protein
MEEFILNYMKAHRIEYVKIENHEIINHIYNLYKYGIDERDTLKMEDGIIDLYYGVYYEIKENYNQMKKYYLMAIEKDYSLAMYNLGYYYQHIGKDYNLSKKYYLMAIEKDCSSAMNNLGYYYQHIEKDYNLSKKYYLMGIEKSNTDAMYNLGYHYQFMQQDYNLMKKYYLMAIEKDCSSAMNNLGYYYQNIEKDYNLAKKYYLMGAEKGNSDTMYNLGYYYQYMEHDYNLMKKYYLMASEKGHKMSIRYLENFYIDNNDTLGLLQLYIKIDDKTKISNVLVNYCNQKIVNQRINSILLEYLNCIDDHDLPVLFKLFKQILNNQINLLEAHFKYAINCSGYEVAKQDFQKSIEKNYKNV